MSLIIHLATGEFIDASQGTKVFKRLVKDRAEKPKTERENEIKVQVEKQAQVGLKEMHKQLEKDIHAKLKIEFEEKMKAMQAQIEKMYMHIRIHELQGKCENP